MTKKKIEDLYKKKINKINKFNKNYYELNDPIVDDSDYDELKKDILKLMIHSLINIWNIEICLLIERKV